MRPDPSELVGGRIDRYEVLSVLGTGGFGVVYLARHSVLGREVALKVLWPDRADDPHAVERFFREARAAAASGSPQIVRVGDAGTAANGMVFLAMERLHGEDLSRVLSARGSLPADEAVPLVRQILSGLSAAHAAGVIHRDLKPANVFVTTTGEVKILDFGISKVVGTKSLTDAGTALGTPQYMAPEQLEGKKGIDARADVYAAGAVLYALLSGRPPHEGGGYDLILRRVKGEAPPPLGERAAVTPALAEVVHRALAVDPEARWPSAAGFDEALASAQLALPAGHGAHRVSIQHDSLQYPTRPASLGAIPVTPLPPRPHPPRPHAAHAIGTASPPARARGVAVALVVSLAGLAVLLAAGLGALAVLAWRVSDQPEAPSSPIAQPAPPAPTPAPTPAPDAIDPEGDDLEDDLDDDLDALEPIDQAADAIDDALFVHERAAPDPALVTFDGLYAGAYQEAVTAFLERTRPDLAACAGAAPVRAPVVFIVRQSYVTMPSADPSRPAGDAVTLQCVSDALERARAVGTPMSENFPVQVVVVLAARRA